MSIKDWFKEKFQDEVEIEVEKIKKEKCKSKKNIICYWKIWKVYLINIYHY